MKRATRHPIWSWIIHTPWVLALIAILLVIVFFGSGAGNPLLRRIIVSKLEQMTGGQVEIRTISIGWLSMRPVLRGLVIHGKEPKGTEPLFSAEEIQLGLRVDSYWGRKISLDDLVVLQPHVHVRVEKNGSTNVPSPPNSLRSDKPIRETLFDLHIKRVRLENGWILYNDIRKPLAVEGSDFGFALDAGGTAIHPLYLGNLDWQSVKFATGRDIPLPIQLSTKFTVWREGLTLEQGTFSAGRSRLETQGEMLDFSQPKWTFRYRAWVNLLDFRQTLREPMVPTGKADFRGEGQYANGQIKGTGSYSGTDIALPYDDFHATGLTSRGSYKVDNNGLVIPDFYAGALGGTVTGRVSLQFDGVKFKAVTHVQDFRLSSVFPHVEHRGFPIDELHWDALLTADTTETWSGAFRHFDITAKMHWDEPENLAAGHTPINGDWQFRYQYDANLFSIEYGDFETPSTRGSISGTLATKNSDLDVKFETSALESYKDFINAIRDEKPDSAGAVKGIGGSVRWDGKILGASGKPTFQGHVRGEQVHYENVAFDLLEGDLTYSPTQLSLERGRARQGAMDTNLSVNLTLTDWSFLPENEWSAEADFEKVPIESIQQIFGEKYPVSGILTGQFHGRGTREEPAITGLIDLADGSVYGLSFNRLRGQVNVMPDEARISNAELRFFPPGTENGRGAGIVTGSMGYRFHEHTISAELVGASLPLENFQKLHSARMAVGGQASFRLKLSGPMSAPEGEGTFRLVDLRIGQTVIGSLDGSLNSDGHIAKLQLSSAMSSGEVSGNYELGLATPYPLNGKTRIKNISLDPFLTAALHVENFSGHGIADGDINVSGELQHPEAIVVDGSFSRFVLTYANMQLENAAPLHLKATRDDLQIDSVTFKGPETNLEIGGKVQFAGRRTVSMRLNGSVDLRLISGFAPDLEVRGPAQVNASVEGTMDRPRITGKVHIEKTSIRAADFPTGISAMKGDLVFDATRLFFNDVTAEAGGGTLRLTGSINYAERPLRYDVNLRSDRVRIRYPEGMSWMAAGTLRLTGTPTAGVLSGRVTIERVTLTEGVGAASALVSVKEGISGPSTSSPFLRNLQFDIEAISTPDARMEWPGAELQADASLRVRGTWEHPILLGHIHILSGELYFAGNRYRVSRGDLNFANPFRLDPVVNVEATTTIQQYEITLNFNGPASKLVLAYRSDPPLPANDIVTLLALGQTTSEASTRTAGATQSSTSGATALLSEAISSQLGGRVERLFGITRFRVDPGLTSVGTSAAGQNAAARVTVEQQITRNLTVTYVSNVSSTQEQVIQVEYNVNRNVSIVALRDYNGTFGIDVKIKKRFP